MKRISHTTIYFSVSLITLLALVGVYWNVYQSIDGQTVRTANVLKEVAKEKYRREHEEAVVKMLKDVEADREKILGYFIHGDQAVDFIEKLESLGNSTGTTLIVSSINADDLSDSPSGTVGKLRAHMSSIGSWPAMMKILLLAEQLPYSVAISNLRLEASGISDATGKALPSSQWKIDLDIEVLSIK
ncbi:MAG: hypothetical protein JWO73_935 [Candidatus Taylorbacteria bacterium]|nr:hypothetical protein [Candidatus Taylorbacteria bacterium]